MSTILNCSDCSQSYLEVVDGASLAAESLGTFCAKGPKKPLVSRGRFLTVRLRTAASVTLTTFRLSYAVGTPFSSPA